MRTHAPDQRVVVRARRGAKKMLEDQESAARALRFLGGAAAQMSKGRTADEMVAGCGLMTTTFAWPSTASPTSFLFPHVRSSRKKGVSCSVRRDRLGQRSYRLRGGSEHTFARGVGPASVWRSRIPFAIKTMTDANVSGSLVCAGGRA